MTPGLKYIRSLDGVRAIAAIMVVFFHSPIPLFQFGWAGVNLFFILSGFLITRILINTRELPFTVFAPPGNISFANLRIDQYRDGPIVEQLYLHIRAKDAGADGTAEIGLQPRDHLLI